MIDPNKIFRTAVYWNKLLRAQPLSSQADQILTNELNDMKIPGRSKHVEIRENRYAPYPTEFYGMSMTHLLLSNDRNRKKT